MKGKIFTSDWERQLETQFLSLNHDRKTAYICSPLRAENERHVLENIMAARAYMFYVSKTMNMAAKAPHAYLPMLLCDDVQEERKLALSFGLQLLARCNVMLVCGSNLSMGMIDEIICAAKRELDICVFNTGLFYRVKQLVGHHGNAEKVQFDCDNYLLAFSWDELKKECDNAVPI